MRRRPIAALVLALVAPALGACAGASADGALNAQDASPSPRCRVHQSEKPGDRYTGGTRADPRAVLELMRYYTANGSKRFCDGKGPTGIDREWSDLYAELSARPSDTGAGPGGH